MPSLGDRGHLSQLVKRVREQRALADVGRVFGKKYPAKGMLLAMGTHSLHQDTWLINGVVRQDDIDQPSLF